MERPTLPDLLPTTNGGAPTAVAATAAARYAAEPEVRAALELMPQLVWTTTPDGYHDYYNEQWYRYTGMPRPGDAAADAEGWNWKNYLHPGDYDRAVAAWSRCLATGEPYEIEYRFKEAATGRYRWFLGRALPRRDADVNGAPGRIVRWFGTCTDIDDQKRAAEQLQDQAVELELTSQQLQEQQAELEVQAETLAEANANLEAALADAVRARRDADAARRQAGAAEAQLRSVFAQAPAAVSVTLGPEHRFVLVNPRAEEAVGRRDLVGQTYAGAFPEFAAQGFAAVLDRVYATGEPFVADEMRVEVPRPDGATEPRWYDFVYQPLRDAAGAVTGVLQHAVDVTPRVTARAALAAASAQLAERTAAAEQARRVAEDARRGAEEARRTAEEANAAKARFLANMSHELRTPLNAIGGHVQLVELGVHGPVSDAQRGALARVQAAQRHLLGLITDILDYAKVEGGRVEYDVRPVDAREVVAAVAPLVEPLFRAKGLAYAVRLPDAPVLVWADRERLGQVLVNLLSNAAKFTDPEQSGAPGPDGGAGEVVAAGSGAGAGAEAGGEAVVVDLAERRTGPGPDGPDAGRPGVVFLRVRDAGRGIARDQQERVFEPFVQVGKRFAGDAPGTGLGLAISRDLARGMGGDLRVRSAAGEGSVFTVTLRRVVDVAGQPTDRRVVDDRRGGTAEDAPGEAPGDSGTRRSPSRDAPAGRSAAPGGG